MEKYTNEELLDVLDSSLRESKELTPKQKAVLGQLYIYDGLNKKDKDGYFYRSNKDLCNDCDIKEEKTLIAAVRKLVLLGFIDTVRGSRKDGASLYRLNRKVIDDYCKTPVKEYSNDYSKQIVEMSNRIRELEITVKKLVERITVIEGKNYSTDTDIEKELELDNEKCNNILNNNFNNNILEKTVSIKELEKEESYKPTEFQLVLEDSLVSVPVEEESQVTPDTDSIEVETTHIPTEEEQFQEWLQVTAPYLKELESFKTQVQLEYMWKKLAQVGREYLDNHEETSPNVIQRMNKTVCSAFRNKKEEIAPSEMDLSEYLSRQHNYGSL